MDVALPSGEAVSSHDFFGAPAHGSRSRCRPRSTITQRKARAATSISIRCCGSAPASRPTRPAAVLVPVVDRPEPMVLLTLRTRAAEPSRADRLPGRQDRSARRHPAAAALREAEEEIGLDRTI